MSRRTETAYKAQSPGESAGLPFRVQHGKALDSGDRVNAAIGVSPPPDTDVLLETVALYPYQIPQSVFS